MNKISYGVSLLSIVALCCAASARSEGQCRAAAPTDFDTAPARWLGGCVAGQAQGLGVMRAGTGEPFEFFAGEMRGGAPVRGILILKQGWKAVLRFDPAHRDATPTSTEQDENHAVFVLATRAAQATAQRFAAAGNRDSAAYYQQLAKQIRDGEPE